MISLRFSPLVLFAAAVLMAAALPALAQEFPAGDWKLALGKKAPCSVSMSADGSVTAAADCPAAIARWKGNASSLQLQTASGETFAVLKARDGVFQGATFADARAVTLSH